MTAKSWVFTLNNYSDDEAAFFASEGFKSLCNVLFVGKETGESGTPHLQGFVTFAKTHRLSGLKKINNRCHWERAKGGKAQNREYCFKDGVVLVDHDRTSPGKRTDIHDFLECYKEHGFKRACIEHPETHVRYHRGLVVHISEIEGYDRRTKEPEVVWAFGPSSIGKTHRCLSYKSYYMADDFRWYDNLLGHDLVVFDEFDKDPCTVGKLLKLMDKYDRQVPIKGAFVRWNPPHILITSSTDPRDLFSENDWIQVGRRLTACVTRQKWTQPWEPQSLPRFDEEGNLFFTTPPDPLAQEEHRRTQSPPQQ